MKFRKGLNDRLDSAIDALTAGERPHDVLASHNGAADELHELIETATALRADALHHAQQSVVAAPRLARNSGMVRAAVQRARLRQRPVPAAQRVPLSPWWRKRVSFASMSVPLGVVAVFGAVGITGGAAAGIVVSDRVNLPQPVQEIASTFHVPGTGSDPDHGSTPRHAGIPGGNSGGEGISISNNTIITLTGQVTNIRGNTFDIVIGDDVWLVVVDAQSQVTGELLEQANATVTGPITAERNMHADTLILTGGVATADDPFNFDGIPGPSDDPRDGDTSPPTQDSEDDGRGNSNNGNGPNDNAAPNAGERSGNNPHGQEQGNGGGDD